MAIHDVASRLCGKGKIDESILMPWRPLSASRFLSGGDGPARARLIRQFESDPRFIFTGAVHPSDVPAFLRQIDIFLYDTVWQIEGFCYATLEAMAAGCAAVARAKGALPVQVHPGETGFLCVTPDQAIEICEELIHRPELGAHIEGQAVLAALEQSPLSRLYQGMLKVMGWLPHDCSPKRSD